MKKVIVIGCPGSGKTTFAEKLQEKTNLPLYYLDAIWHKPDKTHIPREEFDKRIVEIRYQIGNERVVKKIMEKLSGLGHDFVIYRAAVNAVTKNGLEKMGYYGACPNKQYEIDHQMDQGLFLNKKYIERKRDVMKNAYEANKELAAQYAGAIVIEPFVEHKKGEACKLEAISLNERQKQLTALFEDKSGELVSGYKYL